MGHRPPLSGSADRASAPPRPARTRPTSRSSPRSPAIATRRVRRPLRSRGRSSARPAPARTRSGPRAASSPRRSRRTPAHRDLRRPTARLELATSSSSTAAVNAVRPVLARSTSHRSSSGPARPRPADLDRRTRRRSKSVARGERAMPLPRDPSSGAVSAGTACLSSGTTPAYGDRVGCHPDTSRSRYSS